MFPRRRSCRGVADPQEIRDGPRPASRDTSVECRTAHCAAGLHEGARRNRQPSSASRRYRTSPRRTRCSSPAAVVSGRPSQLVSISTGRPSRATIGPAMMVSALASS